ncbi:MAG: HNH endonuclease [Defluviitaleaceae bacterium]|nr:HNH endonuclease [Defluviitaleaceae bacterium]
MRYYLKKCGHQELGSVVNGQASRGRYLFISKDERVLEMFPPLSSTQLNDSAVIPIIPLYSDKKVYCKFVYHNSAVADPPSNGKGRNEYRFYLNRELENGNLLFAADDIVVLRTDKVQGDYGDVQTVYLVDIVKDRNSELYRELSNALENSDVRQSRQGHAIYDGVISYFEGKAEARLRNIENSLVAVDKTVKDELERTDIPTMESLFNATMFRDFVMVGYQWLCAVTREVIRYENFINLESAHIRPKSHGGPFVPSNGLALSRDFHWAFDKGFFTISDNHEIIVHDKISSDYLLYFNGKKIYLPNDPFFRPAPENLTYHRDNVFGLFLTSGRL